jgi:hypothetical protein
VEIEDESREGGLFGEVALEVRCLAFLRALTASLLPTSAGNELRVVGEVVGWSENPLDLYLLVGGETLAYSTVQPGPEGKPFELKSDLGRASGGPIEIGNHARIELVNAGSLWFRADLPIG